MKILVISNTPWSVDNSFGNSFSNIFEGIPDLKFANIYCRPGAPKNDLDMTYYQITEKSLIKNLLNKSNPSGRIVQQEKEEVIETSPINGFDQARKMRWQIMFWMRDLVWKIGKWWTPDLRAFIDDFKPDIIFQPVYYSNYLTEIALKVKEYTDAPMLGYISDDCYTLRQYRFSPLYWIDRLVKRKKVKAVIEKCDVLYVISGIQKEEYQKLFTPPCKVLTKCADFTKERPKWKIPEKEIRLIFAGNIGTGRWRSLALISNAIEKLNSGDQKFIFDIYTPTPLTAEMEKALRKNGTTVHKPVNYEKIIELQEQADVLVHAEGLSLKSRMEVHQSFSTKLVDFFAIGKCILAIGCDDEASIKHLIDNDAALVAGSEKEIGEILSNLSKNKELLAVYGEKAYSCGNQHHLKSNMQQMIVEDLNNSVGKK